MGKQFINPSVMDYKQGLHWASPKRRPADIAVTLKQLIEFVIDDHVDRSLSANIMFDVSGALNREFSEWQRIHKIHGKLVCADALLDGFSLSREGLEPVFLETEKSRKIDNLNYSEAVALKKERMMAFYQLLDLTP
ncbi:hypothetical protein DTO96_102516 [Ephemeroptericola cinctiostellae]|uniref:Uncharacterized protein n=1 Tax=Ephemeroptericola cinctiostellae TaxID=2268024 RepID=A0A345DEH2_9BURK|nr:hypothetical protein [Ephemeroptericola cinctiostellae]AXF86760.1 hypothetical protein DTO96_102516 [Ephemeroptericola cinctiostellae]